MEASTVAESVPPIEHQSGSGNMTLITPPENDVGEIETEKSPVAAQQKLQKHKSQEDGCESDKAHTDTSDEEDVEQQKQQISQVAPTSVETMKKPVDEMNSESKALLEQPTEAVVPQNLSEKVVENEVNGEVQAKEREKEIQPPPSSLREKDVEKQGVEIEINEEDEGEMNDQDHEVHDHEVELVIPSPKRPTPLNLKHYDEAHDNEEETPEGGNIDEEGSIELGTPLGYNGGADFGEGHDEFASHRFLGPSVASDPSSVRALHSLRRVALHDKPPRFVSEASAVAGTSGSVTSSGESSGRNSSSASVTQAYVDKFGLRSQSEADFVENSLNTYTLTFTEPVLGFNTNVVMSLENELLVEVSSVEKDSPAHRGGVVVGDYLISVNGLLIEPHMTKDQVLEIIQTSTVPRTLVFQRDLHGKDVTQSRSLPDKKNLPAKPLMGRLGAAVSQGASIIGSKWKRKKTIVHPNSFCDGCGLDPITGPLWTCSVCSSYNLCSDCYDVGTHGMENSEQMQALSEAIVQYKLQKQCKNFTPEFLQSLRRDICKGRPDKFEYLGEWIANIVVGTPAAKITVRGIEIPSLLPASRQRFVSYLMPLVSNRVDIEVHIEWLADEADSINAACRASVDRMSVGFFNMEDESPPENLEKLRIWISDKKSRTTSPFA